MINLAIFASGNGSNAQNIVEYCLQYPTIQFNRIYCNKADAFVFERAKNLKIPATYFSKKAFEDSEDILKQLRNDQTDFIILAGFLLKIPAQILQAYPNKIINIHPALLPKYGGKGMYGMHVHQAVKAANEIETGISIHLVNEQYDEGKILFQARCDIDAEDSADEIAQKVHALEYKYFPKTIVDYILQASKTA